MDPGVCLVVLSVSSLKSFITYRFKESKTLLEKLFAIKSMTLKSATWIEIIYDFAEIGSRKLDLRIFYDKNAERMQVLDIEVRISCSYRLQLTVIV